MGANVLKIPIWKPLNYGGRKPGPDRRKNLLTCRPFNLYNIFNIYNHLKLKGTKIIYYNENQITENKKKIVPFIYKNHFFVHASVTI